MKVNVNADTCIGCGLCANMAPDVYMMEGSVAVPASEAVPEGQEEAAREMVEDCPVNAISVED